METSYRQPNYTEKTSLTVTVFSGGLASRHASASESDASEIYVCDHTDRIRGRVFEHWRASSLTIAKAGLTVFSPVPRRGPITCHRLLRSIDDLACALSQLFAPSLNILSCLSYPVRRLANDF